MGKAKKKTKAKPKRKDSPVEDQETQAPPASADDVADQTDEPAIAAEGKTEAAEQTDVSAEASGDGDDQPGVEAGCELSPELKRILQIEVPIIVRLAEKKLALEEVLQLSPGGIVEFEKTVEEDLDLMINNKCIGTGVAVKVGENFGLRITRVGSVDETIKAMGEQEAGEEEEEGEGKGKNTESPAV